MTSTMFALLLTTVLLFSLASSDLEVGDICRTRAGTVGVCMELTKCLWANEQFDNGRHHLVTLCGFLAGDVTVVCCSTSGDRVGILTEESRNSTSYRKCLEYSQALEEIHHVPIFIAEPVNTNYTDCKIQTDGVKLIVGGARAKAEEFPHMALLGYGNESDISWRCGGSLISERFILTAAHCLFDRELQVQVGWARLGDINLTSTADDENAVTIAVAEHFPHTGYNPKYLYNDIALLKMEYDVEISSYVRPACIHHVEGFTNPDLVALVTGWGKTKDWLGLSDVLMKAELKFVDHETCQHAYRRQRTQRKLRHGIDRATQVCARDPAGQQDTCQGDSGGPIQLILSEPPCMYDVVGVTSFGPRHCGPGNTPAVYTRVQQYIPWIESIVWP